MDAVQGGLEVERFEDVGLRLEQVDELSFRETFVNPAMAGRLQLHFPPGMLLNPLDEREAVMGIFDDIEAMPRFDVCPTGEHFSRILDNFGCEVIEFHLFFLSAFDVEALSFEDMALCSFGDFNFFGIVAKLHLQIGLGHHRDALSIVQQGRDAVYGHVHPERVETHAVGCVHVVLLLLQMQTLGLPWRLEGTDLVVLLPHLLVDVD